MSPLVLRELTAAGRGAVRVLEVRGPGAWAHVRERLGLGVSPEPFALARLRSGDEVLDEALVVVPHPGSVELHLHGSPAVVRRVLAALALPDSSDEPRSASRWGSAALVPGAASLEDLADEALAEAPSEAAARMLLDQREGALRRGLEAFARDPGAAAPELRERARTGRFLVRPPVVVLAGVANAGKSTLFNALLDRERVLVAARAGTTRDAIRERMMLGALAVDIVDTAGERGPEDEVEAAGQALARELTAGADLVLRLVPWTAELRPPAPVGPREVVVVTQVDRAPDGSGGLSALCDPAGARRTVAAVVRGALGLPEEPWTPGAAVPFPPALAADLARPLADARERVRAWLAGPRGR